MKHFVFAGNMDQATEYAHDVGLTHGQWIYADRRHKLEGLDPRQMVVHRVGTWRENDGVAQAWDHYQRMRQMHGMELME